MITAETAGGDPGGGGVGGRLAGGAERCEGGMRENFFTSLQEFRAYIEAGLDFRLYVFSHCSFYWRMMNPGEQTNFRPKIDQFFLPSSIRLSSVGATVGGFVPVTAGTHTPTGTHLFVDLLQGDPIHSSQHHLEHQTGTFQLSCTARSL